MKRRVFLGLGAASIGAGALHSTGAFSSLSAGRGVAVSAADDSSALLKIEDRETEEPEFTNQTDVTMKITFEPEDNSVTFDGQNADTFVLELDPGADQSETVNLDTSGITPIEVTATLRNDSDESIGSIELERNFGVPQADVISLTANVTNVGNSGMFEFEVINEGEDPVTIDAVAIADATAGDEDDNDPVEVDDELRDEDGGNSDAPGPLDVLGRQLDDPEDEEWVPLNENRTLESDEANTWRARDLVDEDGSNVKLQQVGGGTLDVSFRFTDDSTTTLEMVATGDE